MSNAKRLTKRQTAVIDDLFADVDEERILTRHKVKHRLYEKWMSDEAFIAEFHRRLDSARRQSDLLLARFASAAVAKLVALMQSEHEETSRKACLDIINLLKPNPESKPDEPAQDEQPQDLPPELAGRLLEALAKNETPENENKARHTLL